MFVTGSAGSFAAFGNFGSEGIEDLVSEVAVYLVAVGLEHPTEIVSDGHHPNPPLYFYRWGNLVPILISLPLLMLWHWGLLVLGSVTLFLWGVLK